MYPQSMLSKNKKKIKTFHPKIIVFSAMKNCSMVHGRVFVMLFSVHMSFSYRLLNRLYMAWLILYLRVHQGHDL